MKRVFVPPTLILDLDGPILDGKHRHYRCYRDILAVHGRDVLPIDRYWDMKRGRVGVDELLQATGAGPIAEQFTRMWLYRIELRKYLAFDRVQPHARMRLKQWKSKGISIVLATLRNRKANLLWQLDNLGLTRFFDHVLSASPERQESTKEELIRKHQGIKVADILMWIGDTEVDVVGARRLGVKACAVCSGLRNSTYLSTLAPDFLLRDMHSIDLAKMEVS